MMREERWGHVSGARKLEMNSELEGEVQVHPVERPSCAGNGTWELLKRFGVAGGEGGVAGAPELRRGWEQWGARSWELCKLQGGILTLPQIQQEAVNVLGVGIRPDPVGFIKALLRSGEWAQSRWGWRCGDPRQWQALQEGLQSTGLHLLPSSSCTGVNSSRLHRICN